MIRQEFIVVRPASEQSLSYFVQCLDGKASHRKYIVIDRGDGLNSESRKFVGCAVERGDGIELAERDFSGGMNCECS